MKFYIAEQNIGGDATKEQAEKLIELLKAKGWDVEYGIANKGGNRHLGVRAGGGNAGRVCR